MVRPASPNYSAPKPLSLLVIVLLFATMAGLSQAWAQNSSKPLNLGTIIQKRTTGNAPPPVYLKLPETINLLPRPNQKKAAAKTDVKPPAPGQIAPMPNTANANQMPKSDATPAQNQTPTEQNASTQAADQTNQTEKPKPSEPEIEKDGIAKLQLSAMLTDEGNMLQRGLDWRIYEEKRDENGQMPMVFQGEGGGIETELKTGTYIVYAGYGYANLTKRLVLAKADNYSETFNLRAGAISLNAIASGDLPLDTNLLRFNIYSRDGAETANQELIAQNIKADHVVKMTEGTYHIVSNYGSANARVRGDVEIKAGKLITVTMVHNAAKITLRLVSEPGGEALANTVWTVLTPGGDLVKRAIGAFPTLALAAGDYTAIAKQNDEIYNRDFTVDTGLDRDIEVLATIR